MSDELTKAKVENIRLQKLVDHYREKAEAADAWIENLEARIATVEKRLGILWPAGNNTDGD